MTAVNHTFGIRDQGFISSLPIDILVEALQVRVHKHNVSITTTLRPALAECHAAIRKLSFVAVNVNKCANHLRLAVRVYNSKQRVDAAE